MHPLRIQSRISSSGFKKGKHKHITHTGNSKSDTKGTKNKFQIGVKKFTWKKLQIKIGTPIQKAIQEV